MQYKRVEKHCYEALMAVENILYIADRELTPEELDAILEKVVAKHGLMNIDLEDTTVQVINPNQQWQEDE